MRPLLDFCGPNSPPGALPQRIVLKRPSVAADVRSKSLPFSNRERTSAFRSAGAQLPYGGLQCRYRLSASMPPRCPAQAKI
jgi:hypothetical protein